MTVSGDGKYAILFAIVGGYFGHMQLYITNLEEQGGITGKFFPKPVFDGLENKFTVSEKLQSSCVGCSKVLIFISIANEFLN